MFFILLFLSYQILTFFAFPGVLGYLFYRKVKGKSLGTLKHRLGFLVRTVNTRQVFWFHAVSVGEVLSVEHLIKHLKTVAPDATCYLTTGTASGMAMAQKLSADHVGYLPYDFLPCMLTAFRRLQPTAVILIEAELWPNLLMLARLTGAKLYLLNGRISKRAGRLRSLGRRLLTPFYHLFDHIFAQTQEDQTAFLHLKIPYPKTSVFGNIKTYNVIKKRQVLETNRPAPEQRPATHKILLVGSLHPGELDMYLNLFTTLSPTTPGLKMIIAPRHFQWQATLHEKVTAAGLNAYAWTPTNPLPLQDLPLTQQVEAVFTTHDLLLVCTLGHLFDLYPLADLFFLGGTFVPVGGHNLLEPAVWEVPSIIGPHYQNCKNIADHLASTGGLFKVTNQQELNFITEKLIRNPQLLHAAKRANTEWIAQEASSITNHINQITNLLIEHRRPRSGQRFTFK